MVEGVSLCCCWEERFWTRGRWIREGWGHGGAEGDDLAEFTSIPGNPIVVVVVVLRVGRVEPAGVKVFRVVSAGVVAVV